MGKLSSILLGTVSGAAFALFLTSEKGKKVRGQAADFLDEVRENPEQTKELLRKQVVAATNQTKETLLKTKEQLVSGELTVDGLLHQATTAVKQVVPTKAENLLAKLEQEADNHQDIVIEFPEIKE